MIVDSSDGRARMTTRIGETTMVTLKTVVGVVIVTACVVAGYINLLARIDALAVTINTRMSDSWTKTSDYVFMRDFAATNALSMPDHTRLEVP